MNRSELLETLLAAAKAFAKFPPVEGSRDRHEAFHKLKEVVDEIVAIDDAEEARWDFESMEDVDLTAWDPTFDPSEYTEELTDE